MYDLIVSIETGTLPVGTRLTGKEADDFAAANPSSFVRVFSGSEKTEKTK